MNLRPVARALHSADVVIIAFFSILTVLNILFSGRIPGWWIMVGVNILVIAGICLLAVWRNRSQSTVLAAVHDWYVAPLVFFTFKELYFMIKPMHNGNDYDDLLIEIDRWIFGVDPTVWLASYTHPILTEVLQIAYTSFYFLFLMVGFELYRKHSAGVFHFFMFTCVYGFYLSYLGYFSLPGVGPRFTLHLFSALDAELPGLWLTPYLRMFVNAGESIPIGVSDMAAMAAAQRDVFPSGHTMMTLVLIVLGYRYRLLTRHVLLVVGILLIIATVYQRYHYVIDLVAGALFAVVCLVTAPRLFALLRTRLGTMDSRYPWTPSDI